MCDLSRRELNPGLERCLGLWSPMTSSHTDHYTTEDLWVLAPTVAWCCRCADAPIKRLVLAPALARGRYSQERTYVRFHGVIRRSPLTSVCNICIVGADESRDVVCDGGRRKLKRGGDKPDTTPARGAAALWSASVPLSPCFLGRHPHTREPKPPMHAPCCHVTEVHSPITTSRMHST